MISIVGGDLYQWDVGRSVKFQDNGINATELHFANKGDSKAVKMQIGAEGTLIPDYLLRTGKQLCVYAVDNGVTVEFCVFPVTKRERPEHYIYEEDQRNYIYVLTQKAEEAIDAANGIAKELQQANENGEFDGEDGYSVLLLDYAPSLNFTQAQVNFDDFYPVAPKIGDLAITSDFILCKVVGIIGKKANIRPVGSIKGADSVTTPGSGRFSVVIQDPKINKASGNYAVAEGFGTTAAGKIQHVSGRFNVPDTENKYANIIGGGASETSLKNIHTVDWDGNAYYSGEMTLGDMPVKETLHKKITTPDTAQVGQTVVVEAVDADGRPTKWKTVDLLGGTTLARMEAQDDSDELYACSSHTAAQLLQKLESGWPVLALMYNQGTGASKQMFFFTDGRRLVAGDALGDGGWQHVPGQRSYYVDGDAANRTCNNELFAMY